MKILVSNVSFQALYGVVITYISGSGPVTDTVNLGPFNSGTNVGTNAQSSQSATTCISISVPFNGGSETILYGNTYPMPIPIGFNMKAKWTQSDTAVIVEIEDSLGG